MVLDVGTGTGYPALEILRRMDDQGRIISIASVVGTMGLMAGERAQSMKYWAETGGVLKLGVYGRPPDAVLDDGARSLPRCGVRRGGGP